MWCPYVVSQHHGWLSKKQRALDQLKTDITTRCLAYFDTTWLTEVIVDASPVGMGAILAQVNPEDIKIRRFVSFASRLLTGVERRYSQCEKEALAAVWGCECYWLNLFGQHFTLVTDNRAVQLIFGNTTARPPARIERWALRLTQFDFTIVHRPGSSNIADYLSRNPDTSHDLSALVETQRAERYINLVVSNAVPRALTRLEIAEATKEDETLPKFETWTIRTDRPRMPQHLSAYKPVLDEVSRASDGILLRGSRIIVPDALRERVVQLAHQGHQGIVKTKALIRSRVWYPGIDAQVEGLVRQCTFCQAIAPAQAYQPLKPSEMPKGPWQLVAGDYLGPLADGTYRFASICLYSNWFPVAKLRSTAAEPAIEHLKEILCAYGVPKVYVSDN